MRGRATYSNVTAAAELSAIAYRERMSLSTIAIASKKSSFVAWVMLMHTGRYQSDCDFNERPNDLRIQLYRQVAKLP